MYKVTESFHLLYTLYIHFNYAMFIYPNSPFENSPYLPKLSRLLDLIVLKWLARADRHRYGEKATFEMKIAHAETSPSTLIRFAREWENKFQMPLRLSLSLKGYRCVFTSFLAGVASRQSNAHVHVGSTRRSYEAAMTHTSEHVYIYPIKSNRTPCCISWGSAKLLEIIHMQHKINYHSTFYIWIIDPFILDYRNDYN